MEVKLLQQIKGFRLSLAMCFFLLPSLSTVFGARLGAPYYTSTIFVARIQMEQL